MTGPQKDEKSVIPSPAVETTEDSALSAAINEDAAETAGNSAEPVETPADTAPVVETAENVAPAVENAPSMENSTIFGQNPSFSREKAPARRPRRLLAVLAALLIVAVLAGGIYAVIRFIPVDDGGETSSADLLRIPVLMLESEHITRLRITNSGGSFTLFRKSEESGEGEIWVIDGIDPTLTDSSALGTLADQSAAVTALRQMKSTSGSFGFNTPAATVVITCDGEDYTFTLGAKTADQSGYYAKASGDAVYVVSDYYYDLFTAPATGYASTTLIPALSAAEEPGYFSEDALYKIDSLILSGTDYAVPLRFGPNPVSTYGVNFVMTSPYSRYADDEALRSVLSVVTGGLSAESLYSYTADPSVLTRYGLDSPRAVFDLKVGSHAYTLRVGAAEDGYSAVAIEGKNAVYKVKTDSLSFLGVTAESCLSSHVVFEDIKSLTSVVFAAEGLSADYQISYSESELSVTLDGRIKSAAGFKNLYYHLIALRLQQQEFEPRSGRELLRVTVNFNDSARNSSTAVFSEVSDRTCFVTVDGTPYGTLPKSYVTDIITYASALRDGKEVPGIN